MAVTTKLTYGGVVHDIHDKEIEDLRLSANEGKAIGFNASGEAIAIDTIEKATKDGNGNTIVSTYLPLSGGTMSGTITTSSTDGLVKTSTASLLNLCGGTNTNSGASLILSGKDKATYPGEFWLNATSDGVNIKSLIGKPDGSFTWNGNSVITAAGGAMTGELNDKQGYPVYGVPNTPEAHNCLYRGKEHTVEGLSAKVLANDFSDIFIGDYFKVSFSTAYGTVSNQKVLVAGINYFKNCGDTDTTTPHLVMIPETSFGSAAMNSTNTTVGGYAGSDMHTTVLPAIATALKGAIGASHVVAQRRLLSTEMTATTPSMAGAGRNGASTGWGWTDCDLCLMSEPMVYGTMVLSSSLFDVGDRKQQLPIFALNPQLANIRSNWWLSSVDNAYSFALVRASGHADNGNASNSNVVRPLLVFR